MLPVPRRPNEIHCADSDEATNTSDSATPAILESSFITHSARNSCVPRQSEHASRQQESQERVKLIARKDVIDRLGFYRPEIDVSVRHHVVLGTRGECGAQARCRSLAI